MSGRYKSFRSVGLLVAICVVAATVLFGTSVCGLLPPGSVAWAQGVTEVSICGGCNCYSGAERAQCEANERAEYERANPPRGQMEGVCTARFYRNVRNPDTQAYTWEVQNPVYSKFRYSETSVDGFNEVTNAWREFAKPVQSMQPAGAGWDWSSGCYVLTGGGARNSRDGESWSRDQSQASYQRVFMPVFGVADTPEERALEARIAQERAAKLAEHKRIADAKAAEAARIKAASEAKRRAQIAAMEAQLGPGKRASAERLLAMNEEVAKFRPKVPLAVMPRPSSSASATRQCSRRQASQPVSFSAATREAAEAGIVRARATPGGSETIVQSVVSAASCSQQKVLQLTPPPVGNCLSCISEKMAASMYGWIKGRGYPPAKSEWVCKAAVSFIAERCASDASKVIGQ